MEAPELEFKSEEEYKQALAEWQADQQRMQEANKRADEYDPTKGDRIPDGISVFVTFILFADILFFAVLIGKTPRFCLYPCSTVRTFGIKIGAAFVICVADDFLIHDGADFVKNVSDCFSLYHFLLRLHHQYALCVVYVEDNPRFSFAGFTAAEAVPTFSISMRIRVLRGKIPQNRLLSHKDTGRRL